MCPPEYKRNYVMGVSARKDTAFSDLHKVFLVFLYIVGTAPSVYDNNSRFTELLGVSVSETVATLGA